MSDILRMLELFEMNHEFGPAAQRDIEEIIAAVRATPAPVAPKVLCVGRARYSRTGGNAGLSWFVENAPETTCAPKDKELIYVLAAAQAQEGKP